MRRLIVRHIREQASQLACNNVLYNWSLGGGVPHGLAYYLSDTWPGDANKGRLICTGSLAIEGVVLSTAEYFWTPEGANEKHLEYIHSFEWLRDLKAVGGDFARKQARDLVLAWINNFSRWSALEWRADILGRRIANWIAFYDFFGESAEEEFQEQLFNSLIRQARHLGRAIPGNTKGLDLFYGIKGLAFCGLAFEKHENWLAQALDLLQEQIKKQILSDGVHVSRSPSSLLEVTRIIVDIKSFLILAGYTVPEDIEHVIDRMTQALRFFRYPDKKMAIFNGSQEEDITLIDSVLSRANIRGRVLTRLPEGGYERVTVGRSLIMMDSGSCPKHPYDDKAHAAPLAFEFIYGRERVFVNCGAHLLDADWNELLRGTVAHNLVSVDYRNVCEIREDKHFGRKPRNVLVTREDKKNETLIEGSHDGYVPLNGISHRRRLFLTDQGHKLRGEENLSCSVGLGKPVDIALRFHLHPRVLVSLINDGNEALLRLSGGAGWRFIHQGGLLSLENSVYLGDGVEPRKTKQLVIYGTMERDFAQIKWGLHREMH
jgi:uncharacterized heparinase superfamily protein